ncbi:YbhB/YbcL family Raf kinase inhibitor-like protein [Pantoea sp. App145]|uniref:YbhB/YbcL family Raf kinase inhibitor-like protein n=1 Tax=Pantoea sp. App145 TaxID=3071567 RepID=UPI003A7F941F
MTNRRIIAIAALSFIFTGPALATPTFTLTSPQVKQGHFASDQLLSAAYGFGCQGNNHSPVLNWQGAPAGTRSFALQIYDRDAPTGMGWVHWQVVNIPGNATSLAGGIATNNQGLPGSAIQTRTDFGMPGYGGPCPPLGTRHRYVITLTALKTDKLPNVNADSTPALVGYMTHALSLGSARLEITQSR